MKKQAYRMAAPRTPRAVPVARTLTGHGGLMWLAAGLGALALTLAAGAVHGQVLPAAASGPTTVEYVQQSAMTQLFEIVSSRVALDKSHNPEVRDFAQQILNDHGRSTAELKQALKDGKLMITVPALLDPRQEQELTALRQRPADQFDQAYLLSQLQGHRNALDMQRAYAQSGANAALKQFAARTSSRVQGDLVKLETLAQQARVARMCEAPAGPDQPEG